MRKEQEPITRSFHLPYWPSESTLSRIFLFLESPSTGTFAGVFYYSRSWESCGPLLSHVTCMPHESICGKRGKLISRKFDIYEATSPENRKSFRTPNSGIYNTQKSTDLCVNGYIWNYLVSERPKGEINLTWETRNVRNVTNFSRQTYRFLEVSYGVSDE